MAGEGSDERKRPVSDLMERFAMLGNQAGDLPCS